MTLVPDWDIEGKREEERIAAAEHTVWIVTNSRYTYNDQGDWKTHVLRPDDSELPYCNRRLSIWYDQPHEEDLDRFGSSSFRRGFCKQCLDAMIREKLIAKRGRLMNEDGTAVG